MTLKLATNGQKIVYIKVVAPIHTSSSNMFALNFHALHMKYLLQLEFYRVFSQVQTVKNGELPYFDTLDIRHAHWLFVDDK